MFDDLIESLINFRKNGNPEAMDGDEVESFCDIIRYHMDYKEGNLTLTEFVDRMHEVSLRRESNERDN